ncbi:MAG: UDP-N-acetylglucosamine 2-epimerase (non-hydrolyzing) [Candidatus Gastranaerophilales bacterium]|nr:UDP-N-acetylglucosamine 2-epimerase (non-hydrolyzing) [Candidatus Gastranaerophilales bacterium]
MDNKVKIALVFGTRPEAIKMCPLVRTLKRSSCFEVITIVTAQHREMLDSVLELFEIKPDYDLNLMKPNQNLWDLSCDILQNVKKVLDKENPDLVLVHGDTTTAGMSALSTFYSRIKIGHVEAGLRTFDKDYPFPEEINRVMVDSVSDLMFCPTDKAVENLKNSGIKKGIYKTGNTVIDALLYVVNEKSADIDFIGLNPNLKTILLTSHRRENFGKPLENICNAIKELIEKYKDIQVVYPLHLNPNVRNTVMPILGGVERVKLIDPLDYAPFSTLMKKSHIILTDSGGIQEEAPALGVPVLVLRDETERPEAIKSGSVRLAGTNKDNIIKEVTELLTNKTHYENMSHANNPYGDGRACIYITDIIKKYFNL